MGQQIAKLILETVTPRILLPEKLVAGVIGHHRHITAKIADRPGRGLGLQFKQPPDQLRRNFTGEVSCLVVGEVTIRRVTYSQFVSNDIANDRLGRFADQLLEGSAASGLALGAQERQQDGIALCRGFQNLC